MCVVRCEGVGHSHVLGEACDSACLARAEGTH